MSTQIIETVQRALDRVSHADIPALGSMLSETVHFSLPFSSESVEQKGIAGRGKALAMLKDALAQFERFQILAHEFWQPAEGNVIIVEATSIGVRKDQSVYQNRYALIVRFSDQLISDCRCYSNPLMDT